MAERKVVTLELVENCPHLGFLFAWTQGWLSVRTCLGLCDWMILGVNCFINAPIARASISHGSQLAWCLHSLALTISLIKDSGGKAAVPAQHSSQSAVCTVDSPRAGQASLAGHFASFVLDLFYSYCELLALLVSCYWHSSNIDF